MVEISNTIGFFNACAEARGPPELQDLDPGSNPAASLLNHAPTHGIPINLPYGINRYENKGDIRYCAHDSKSKEVDFFHQELAEQVQAGHIAVFPLDTASHLHKLWLSTL